MLSAFQRAITLATFLVALTLTLAADTKPDPKTPPKSAGEPGSFRIPFTPKQLAAGPIIIPGPDGSPYLVRIGSDGRPTMAPASPDDLKKYPRFNAGGTGAAPAPPRKLEKPASPFDKQVLQDKSVQAALTWLSNNQNRDGSWATGMGNNRPAIVVTTSLAGLALMTSGKKQYALNLTRAADFVADNVLHDPAAPVRMPENLDQSNWKVAVGGYFLCEYYGAQKRANRGFKSVALERIITAVVADAGRRMEISGGWGHTPRLKNPLGYVEMEVMSNWMLTMLGSAQAAGFKVPEAPIDKAVGFIEACCNKDHGDVGYSPRDGQKGFGCPCRTGGAIFAFQLLKRRDNALYPRMVESFKSNIADSNEGHGSLAISYLAAALAARHLEPEVWQDFKDRFFPQILEHAQKDGTFAAIKGQSPQAQANADPQVGSAYTTAIYVLILQFDKGRMR